MMLSWSSEEIQRLKSEILKRIERGLTLDQALRDYLTDSQPPRTFFAIQRRFYSILSKDATFRKQYQGIKVGTELRPTLPSASVRPEIDEWMHTGEKVKQSLFAYQDLQTSYEDLKEKYSQLQEEARHLYAIIRMANSIEEARRKHLNLDLNDLTLVVEKNGFLKQVVK